MPFRSSLSRLLLSACGRTVLVPQSFFRPIHLAEQGETTPPYNDPRGGPPIVICIFRNETTKETLVEGETRMTTVGGGASHHSTCLLRSWLVAWALGAPFREAI